MSAETEPRRIPLWSGDIEHIIKDLDQAMLDIVLLTPELPAEVLEPLQRLASVRGLLNDAMEKSDGENEETEADHG